MIEPAAPVVVRAAYVALAGLLAALVIVDATSLGSGTDVSEWVYDAVIAGCAAVCISRAWILPGERAGWALIGAGLGIWAVGEVALTLFGEAAWTVADATFVGYYACALPGLWLLCQRRSGDRLERHSLDTLVGTLTVAACWAALVHKPLSQTLDQELSASTLLAVAYPLGDLLLLLLLVIALAGAGWRADGSFALLAGGLWLVAVADTVYAWQDASGSYVAGTLLDAAWPAGTLLIALAAWRPAREPRATTPTRRLVLPAVFACVALALIVLHDPADLGAHDPADIGGLSYGLALAALAAAVARSIGLNVAHTLALTRLREVNRMARFGRWEVDMRTRRFRCSEELGKLLGLPSNRPIRYREFVSLVRPEDSSRAQALLDEVSATGGVADYRLHIATPQGEVVMRVNAQVELARDRVVRIYGSAQDVTDRDRAERAVKDAEELFRTVFRTAPRGLSVVAADGTRLLINEAYADMLGYSVEELQDRNFIESAHPDDVAADLERLRAAHAGEFDNITFEKRYLHKAGHEVKGRVNVGVVRDEDGSLRYAISQVEDITEEERQAAERRELESRLRQVEKLDGIGTLAGGIAHDFNNLLAVILNYSDFLLQDATDERVREDLRELRAAAERGAALTRQLLVFTRKGLSEPEIFEVDKHVERLQALLLRTVRADIKVQTELDAPERFVRLDPSELDQILMNLAVNASQAMPAGGELRVCTEVATASEVAKRAPELPTGEYLKLTVVDTGRGMPPDVLARATEPFFTTKAGGTGLGLATVYGVATKAGGTLLLESSPGAGTEACVYLPLTEDSPDAAKVDPPRADTPASASVLIVEDERPVRELAARILRGRGFVVSCAASGDDALLMAQISPPNVLVTDVVMPGVSGPQLVARVREVNPDVKVVYMSGYNEDALLQGGVERGEARLVQKPFDAQDLIGAVHAELQS